MLRELFQLAMDLFERFLLCTADFNCDFVIRVYDFNQGLLYVTNATTGYCNITSIPPLSTPFVVAVVNDTKVNNTKI